MNINDIMENLEECLIFGATHSFYTINFDVVSIQNTQIDIDQLMEAMPENMYEAIRVKAEQYISHWKSFGLIKDYVKTDNGIMIVPNNDKQMKSYIGGTQHYTLVFNKSLPNITA